MLNPPHCWCESCHCPMEWDGAVLTSYPPQYRLECPECGALVRVSDKVDPNRLLDITQPVVEHRGVTIGNPDAVARVKLDE